MDFLEYLVPTSLLGIVVETLLVVIVGMKLFLDIKETRRSQKLYRQLIAAAKKSSRQTFSIIVELNRKADTLIPLLDHLYAHKYSKLEVIVVIKQSAGKNAKGQLENYRRRNRIRQLRLIKHVKGLSLSTVSGKYATGSLLMVLSPSDRLSKGFFEQVSLNAIANDSSTIIPQTQLSVDNTLASAIAVHFSIWKSLFDRILNQTNSKAYIVIPAVTTGMSVQFKVNSISLAKLMHRKTYLIFSLIVITSLASAFYMLGLDDSILLGLFILGLYSLINIISVLGLRGYKPVEKINLILLAPFGLAYGLLALIVAPFRLLESTKVRRAK